VTYPLLKKINNSKKNKQIQYRYRNKKPQKKLSNFVKKYWEFALNILNKLKKRILNQLKKRILNQLKKR
jgi:hypothetical protein